MSVNSPTTPTGIRQTTLSFLGKTRDWTATHVWMLVVFVLTMFLSATLLMSVQPMIGKLITPLLGGTPAVWNTCMVFFEALLLLGYCYAHFATRTLGVRKQAILHLVVLALPFLFFPIAINDNLIEGGLDNPIPRLLLLLIISVGVPFFVVSTSAPLLTRWFSTTTHVVAKDPYFLYGASNLGSMLGLLSYPVLIEPLLGVQHAQPWAWAIGYTLLVLLIGGSAAFLWLLPAAQPEAEAAPASEKQFEMQAAPAPIAVALPSESIQPAVAKVGVAGGRNKRNRKGNRYARDNNGDEPVNEQLLPVELVGNATWQRRLRWVLLAAVPCSLMLGATTYMTTDIAAIPFLWVLPLALYLLSFILVFAKISPLTQSVVVFLTVEGLAVFLGTYGLADTQLDESVIWMLRIVLIVGGLVSLYLLTFRLTTFIHICCVGALPLVVLLLLFMMLSEIRLKIEMTIGIHLVTLFIVSMVCHGQLALDRPPTKYLTEFFLWMSFGGVVGGIFNALLAPVIFNSIVEYQLAMVVACLLLPPLGMGLDTEWAYYLDIGLTSLSLTVGTLLIASRLWENDIPFARLMHGSEETIFWIAVGVLLLFGVGLFAALRYKDHLPNNRLTDLVLPLILFFSAVALNLGGVWAIYLLTPHGYAAQSEVVVSGWLKWGVLPALFLACLAVNGGLAYVLYQWRASYQRMQVLIDIILPFAVLILVVGLIWGLQTAIMYKKMGALSKELGQQTMQMRIIFTFGVPAVLVYTFAERSTRFGLAVGAVLLASAFTNIFNENILYQERSFFGVLRVEADEDSHRLVHGTTLHGQQFIVSEDKKEEYYKYRPGMVGADAWPLTYYHRTGPIGNVCQAYNSSDDPPSHNLGVIGLGTGTMACYAQKDQKITFYDIDPVVKKITWDTDKYFTYLKQARERGAKLDLVMGDARLSLKRAHFKEEDKFSILVVDAFSSDAIPWHLMTYEALELYLDKMVEEGLLCFHISNRHLNLKPVLGNLAAKYTREKSPLVAYYMEDGEDALGKAASTWVVLARDPKYLSRLNLYDTWDQTMGLEPADEKTEDGLKVRMARYHAMQQLVGEAHQKLANQKVKENTTVLQWEDVRPPLKWDKTRLTLQTLCVQAWALKELPRWIPVPVDPSKGEWTDDYAPLFKVFMW